MTPDNSAPLPGSARRELVEGEISGKIIGAFFLVYNTLGFGFLERVYERAMYVALKNRGVRVERQVMFDVYFEGELVGRHRADLLVEGRVVVEVKATHTLPNASKRQLLNYLTALNLELGLVLHFGPTAQYYRVLSKRRPTSATSDPV
jgi:GxxExxY protein